MISAEKLDLKERSKIDNHFCDLNFACEN